MKKTDIIKRQWGTYKVLAVGDEYKVKLLTIDPGKETSLQLHHKRSEIWNIISGYAKVHIGDMEFIMTHGESIFVPVEEIHKIINNDNNQPLIILELQLGDCYEEDIVRFVDNDEEMNEE